MNILLVDDKYDVVQGIAQGVDWATIGNIQLYYAYSGEEALKIIQKNHIQLLITDIEMPGMSGLELASTLHKQRQDIGVIFLTSHDSFRYAQTAIRLGCHDYILQPVEYEKLQSSIIRVINQILIQKMETKDDSGASYSGDTILRQEQAWREVLIHKPPYDARVMRDILEDVQVYPRMDRRYRVVLAVLYWKKETLDNWITHRMENDLIRSLWQALPGDTHLVAGFMTSGRRWVLILDGGDVVPALEELASAQSPIGGSTLAIYVSFPTEFAQLPHVYQGLDKLINNNVGRYGGVFEYQEGTEILTDELVISDMLEVSKWKEWLLEGAEDRIREDVAHFLRKKDEEKRLDKRTLVVIAQLIVSTLYSFEIRSTEMIMAETRTMDSFIQATDSASKLLAFLDEVILRYQEKVSALDRDGNTALLKQIKNYVSGHLGCTLNREEIAEKFFISKDYLSHMFAKNEGLGFTQYVNEQRMNKAQELLRSTNLPIKIIALNVGISDYAYFSKMFRKSTGISAEKYRTQYQGHG